MRIAANATTYCTGISMIVIRVSALMQFTLKQTTKKPTDDLRLFSFSRKIVHAHISGRQNKDKLKEKHVQSSEQLVNRVPTSLHTSFISVDFGKKLPDSSAAFGCTK